jgi:3-deoxy-manno-octulosonate cytidylyltransferase (CMP-KDO synthetase)
VVRDAAGYALYFSRSVIPFSADPSTRYFRHIGLYCFRSKFLKTWVNAEPSPLEKAESLEQLSFLYHGHPIHVDEARVETMSGVDLPSDVERVEAYLRRRV